MSDRNAPDTLNSALFLNVAFAFDSRWTMGPDGRITKFPPGLGLGGEDLQIGPVRFDGMSQEQIAAAIAKRAGDMALVAKAIAVANTQFADALAAVGFGEEDAP